MTRMVFSLAIIAGAIGGCIKPTSQPDTIVKPIENADTASQTIDAAGGTITNHSFSFSLPAGSYASSTRVTVSRDTAPWAYSDAAVSPLYTVIMSGTPAETITIKFSVVPSINRDSLDIVKLFAGYRSSDATTDTSYLIIDSTITNGDTITGIFRATIKPSVAKQSKSLKVSVGVVALLPPALIFGALKYAYNKTSSVGNFIAYGHYAFTTPPDAVLNQLEDAYAKLNDMGFDMSLWRATKNWPWWPFRCYIYPSNVIGVGMSDNEYAFFRPNWISRNLDYMAINAKYLATARQMNACLGHEFFHAIQSCYNHEDNTTYRWIMEASSAWFETKMNGSGWIPVTVNNSPHFYAEGIEGVTASDKAFHGYPMFLFLGYLSDRFGDGVVTDIWKGIIGQSKGSYCAASAIDLALSAHTTTLDAAFRDFANKFTKGEVRSYWKSAGELSTVPMWTITKAVIDSGKELRATADFPDFSFHLLHIGFADDISQLAANTPFTFKSESRRSDFMVSLLDEESQPRVDIATVDSAHPEFTIPDIKTYANKSIVAVMVNTVKSNAQYTGKSSRTVSNGVNYLVGKWTWTITPVTDGCRQWSSSGETFRFGQTLTNGVLSLGNIDESTSLEMTSFTLSSTGFTINAGSESDGFVINSTIVDHDTWNGDLTLTTTTFDDLGNEVPCTSVGHVTGKRD
jgi:hypothetical protein